MPVYDYLCSACDHRADILHGINDPGPRYCPSCGAEATMRKQFAAPAIHFKGTGWAKKDRGGSGASTRASAKSAASDAARESAHAGDGKSSATPSEPSSTASEPSGSSSTSSESPKPSTSSD
jgi:putative FmdB family regulatory protein